MAAQFPSICFIKRGLCCTVDSQNKPEKIAGFYQKSTSYRVFCSYLLHPRRVAAQDHSVFTLPFKMSHFSSPVKAAHDANFESGRLFPASIRICSLVCKVGTEMCPYFHFSLLQLLLRFSKSS